MAFLLLCCRLLFLFPSLYSPSIFVTGGIPAAAFSASVSVSVSVFSRLAYHELRTGRPEAYQDLNVRMTAKWRIISNIRNAICSCLVFRRPNTTPSNWTIGSGVHLLAYFFSGKYSTCAPARREPRTHRKHSILNFQNTQKTSQTSKNTRPRPENEGGIPYEGLCRTLSTPTGPPVTWTKYAASRGQLCICTGLAVADGNPQRDITDRNHKRRLQRRLHSHSTQLHRDGDTIGALHRSLERY